MGKPNIPRFGADTVDWQQCGHQILIIWEFEDEDAAEEAVDEIADMYQGCYQSGRTVQAYQ